MSPVKATYIRCLAYGKQLAFIGLYHNNLANTGESTLVFLAKKRKGTQAHLVMVSYFDVDNIYVNGLLFLYELY